MTTTKDLKIRLDEKTHRTFKVKLAKNSHTAQDVLESAVYDYLEGNYVPGAKFSE